MLKASSNWCMSHLKIYLLGLWIINWQAKLNSGGSSELEIGETLIESSYFGSAKKKLMEFLSCSPTQCLITWMSDSEYSKSNIEICKLERCLQLVGNRQKGESQNGCFKKTRHTKFSEKRTFLTRWYTHTYICISGVKKCSLFGKFGMLCFLETPVLSFALLPYYQRNNLQWQNF